MHPYPEVLDGELGGSFHLVPRVSLTHARHTLVTSFNGIAEVTAVYLGTERVKESSQTF